MNLFARILEACRKKAYLFAGVVFHGLIIAEDRKGQIVVCAYPRRGCQQVPFQGLNALAQR